MRALIFCLLISAVHAAQAQTCVETIPKTASKTSSTAMAVGTVVAIAAAETATANPQITFIAGEIGCEYGEAFAEAWKNNKAALVIFGSTYAFAEMPISKETGQYFIQFVGKVGEETLDAAPQGDIKVADVLATPTLVTASEAAKIAEKNGIDGKHVATAIVLMNPTQAAAEILIGDGTKKVIRQAGKDLKNGADKLCGNFCD